MSISPKLFLSASLMAALAACGGTSVSVPAASFVEGPTSISYTPTTGALSLGGAVVADPQGQVLHTDGGANLIRSTDGSTYSARAQNAHVYALTASTIGGAELTSATFGRTGSSVLSGSGTYTGEYARYYVRNPAGATNQFISTAVDGDVSLTANLSNSTVSGAITNRRSLTRDGVFRPTPQIADLTISGGTIAANGTFSATATGGEYRGSAAATPYTTANGRVNGVFGGANGEAAAGVLRIETTSPGGTDYVETGAFVTTKN